MDKKSYDAGWDAFEAGEPRDAIGDQDVFWFQWGWDAAAQWALDKLNLVP